MRRTAVFFFLLLFFTASLFSQKDQLRQTIRGEVFEEKTLQPIEYASVVVESDGKQFTSLTDSLGRFQLSSVPVGRCKLWVGMLGYHHYVSSNVLLLSQKETILRIPLEESVVDLNEIEITPEINKKEALNKMAGVSSRMLSVEEANRYAGAIGDPARMVANLAGVVAANDSRNDIVIRGNSPMGVLWRLDGFDIDNPNHFGAMGGTGGPIGMINSNQLANSDFYTGAFPAEFGNATAGVFDLRLRKGNNQKHEFLAGMGFNGLELGAEGPLSKKSGASYLINARYSFLRLLSTIGVMPESLNGAIPEYRDLSFKFDIPLKSGNLSIIGLLGASHINIKDNMSDLTKWESGDRGMDLLNRNKQGYVGVNYTHRFGRNTRLENRISIQSFNSWIDRFVVEFENASRDPFYLAMNSENRYTINSTLHHRFNAKNSLVAGVGTSVLSPYMKERIMLVSGQDLAMLSDGRLISTLYNGHIQWEHRFNNKIKISPGVYAQYYDFTNDYSIEPRLGMRWQWTEKISFNAGAAILSQLPPRQMLMYIDSQSNYLNKDVEMNKSAQIVAGWGISLAPSLYLKTEFYYQQLYNIALPEDKPAESSLNFGDDFYNSWHSVFINEGKGKNYGVELTLEKFFSNNYYLLITASLYNSKYLGLDKIERNTKFNGNFSLNTLMGYEWRIGANMQLSINAKVAYLGGKRFVPLTVNSETPTVQQYDYSSAYAKRLPDYFRADLNLSMKQNFKKISIEWFCEVGNLTNHKNVMLHYYNSKKQQMEYIHQLGIMPGGGTKIYF